jgi:hypothetical protein
VLFPGQSVPFLRKKPLSGFLFFEDGSCKFEINIIFAEDGLLFGCAMPMLAVVSGQYRLC